MVQKLVGCSNIEIHRMVILRVDHIEKRLFERISLHFSLSKKTSVLESSELNFFF